MGDIYFMGYKVHKNIEYFTPNTVLFSNGTSSITVEMANDALDYALGIIAKKIL